MGGTKFTRDAKEDRDLSDSIFKRYATLYSLNIFDAFTTYYFVSIIKVAEELNPAMKFLINIDPLLFLLFKFVVGMLIYKLAKESVFDKKWNIFYLVLTGLYGVLAVNHLLNLAFYLFR